MKPNTANLRRKTKHYSDLVYGARVTWADARVLDDYARAHNLARTDVVRLGLHQFALRQQMRRPTPDTPDTPALQAVAEQLRPVQTRLEELTALLREWAACLPHAHPAPPAASVATAATLTPAQHKLLEQILVTVSLALRLQVNYTIAPVLDALPSADNAALAPHLHQAAHGREQWSAATRAVFQRAGQRILQELGSVLTQAPESTPETR